MLKLSEKLSGKLEPLKEAILIRLQPLLGRLQNWLEPKGSELDQSLDEIRQSRLTIRITGMMLAVFLIWSALFKVDVASHSTGEVIAAGQTKLVQHLEGGIVRKILVREGQVVRQGDPLAELERAATEADMNELEAQMAGLQIIILRLESQLAGKSKLEVPADLARRYPEQVQNARELLASQKSRLSGSIDAQQYKIAQRDAELSELRARRAQTVSRLQLLRQQIEINKQLLKEGLANQYEHLNLLKEEQSLVGSLSELDASLRRVVAAQKQESASLQTLASGDREQLQKDLEDSRKRFAEFQERFRKYTDSQQRTLIRSPINGVVMTLNVVTEGGIVPPGGTLMSLVPGNDALLIEARLPVGDVGLIHAGQEARIQLMSATARGFQPMSGKVVSVSPDSVIQENQEPYYRVRIAPEKLDFRNGSSKYMLVPGVMVSVSILTGERSVLRYLADPLVNGMGMAISEP